MKLYSAIDLHANNSYLGIINEEAQQIFSKKLPNDLKIILQNLNPFKREMKGVVVESTFNWYWLVDGLLENGYKVHLANPSAIKQYEGLKHTDDKWDAFWLAHILRLGILPEGYIYLKEERPLRDLLRKRLKLVRERTAHILSLQSMLSRNLGENLSGNEIKKLKPVDADRMFDQPHLIMAAKASLRLISCLNEQIQMIEKEAMSKLKLKKSFQCLLNIPGIGNILALTIMLEVGDISRFKEVGNYSSYCRCVTSRRISNDKVKGKGNTKNGNKYLSWAYVEAANLAIRHCPYAKKFYQRKLAKSDNALAIKALSNKLARATYYVIRDQVAYDPRRLFV